MSTLYKVDCPQGYANAELNGNTVLILAMQSGVAETLICTGDYTGRRWLFMAGHLKNLDQEPGSRTQIKNLDQEPGSRTWIKNLDQEPYKEPGSRTWIKNPDQEPGSRTWIKNLDQEPYKEPGSRTL
jgi:hypothetical protein